MAHDLLICALMAMAPVVELRGALPAGLAMGIPALPLYLLCVVCNLIPVPFIIVFIRRILGWMARRGGDHHAGPQSRRRGNLLIQQKTHPYR